MLILPTFYARNSLRQEKGVLVYGVAPLDLPRPEMLSTGADIRAIKRGGYGIIPVASTRFH
jgi:hypothetical protein